MEKYDKTTTHKHFPYFKTLAMIEGCSKIKRMTEATSSISKHSRNPCGSSQKPDDRTYIGINDDSVDVAYEQPLRRSIGRNKAKNVTFGSGSKNSSSSVIDHFLEFDRYVQIQESKATMMSQVEQKMVDA